MVKPAMFQNNARQIAGHYHGAAAVDVRDFQQREMVRNNYSEKINIDLLHTTISNLLLSSLQEELEEVGGGLWSATYNYRAQRTDPLLGTVQKEDCYALYRGVLRVLAQLGNYLSADARVVAEADQSSWNAMVQNDATEFGLSVNEIENAYLILHPPRHGRAATELINSVHPLDNSGIINGTIPLFDGHMYPFDSPCLLPDWTRKDELKAIRKNLHPHGNALIHNGQGRGRGRGRGRGVRCRGRGRERGQGSTEEASHGDEVTQEGHTVQFLDNKYCLHRLSSIQPDQYVTMFLGCSHHLPIPAGHGRGRGRGGGLRKRAAAIIERDICINQGGAHQYNNAHMDVVYTNPMSEDKVRDRHVSMYAHEFLLWCIHGIPIPDALIDGAQSRICAMHICNNKQCLNPLHIWYGSYRLNRLAVKNNVAAHLDVLNYSVFRSNAIYQLENRELQNELRYLMVNGHQLCNNHAGG